MSSVKKLCQGFVRHGHKNDRVRGYPTANILNWAMVEEGTYYGRAIVGGKKMDALVLSVGSAWLGVHLCNYRGDLYHKPIRVMIKKKLAESVTPLGKYI